MKNNAVSKFHTSLYNMLKWDWQLICLGFRLPWSGLFCSFVSFCPPPALYIFLMLLPGISHDGSSEKHPE